MFALARMCMQLRVITFPDEYTREGARHDGLIFRAATDECPLFVIRRASPL